MNNLKNAVGIHVREWADGPWSLALREKGGEDVKVDPNDWTKDLIVSAAQGYFKESPPSESLLPELETVVP